MSFDRSQIEELIKSYLAMIEEEKRRTGLPIIKDAKTGDPLYFDQRELRLRYLIPVKGVREFFEGLARGEVLYTKCSSCGGSYFPPAPSCPRCGADIVWNRITGEGELLSYTKIYAKPSSFLHHDDYIVGIAVFPEGVKVLAWVRSRNLDELRVGMRVRLETERREPENYYTYVLVPAEGPAVR